MAWGKRRGVLFLKGLGICKTGLGSCKALGKTRSALFAKGRKALVKGAARFLRRGWEVMHCGSQGPQIG